MMKNYFNLMENTKATRTSKQISKMQETKMMQAKMIMSNMAKRSPCLTKTHRMTMTKSRKITKYLKPPEGGGL